MFSKKLKKALVMYLAIISTLQLSQADKVYDEAITLSAAPPSEGVTKGREAMGILTDLSDAAKTFNDVAKEL